MDLGFQNPAKLLPGYDREGADKKHGSAVRAFYKRHARYIAGVSRDPFGYVTDEKVASVFRDWVMAEMELELAGR